MRPGFWLALLAGCAGFQKDCIGTMAEGFGADWIIVQTDLSGRPFRCWALKDVSVSNESASDGIWWQTEGGNLVHISGLYNRVQVKGDRWDEAYAELGLTEEVCEAVHSAKFDPAEGTYESETRIPVEKYVPLGTVIR